MEPAAVSKHRRYRSAGYWRRIRRRVTAVVDKILKKNTPDRNQNVGLEPQAPPTSSASRQQATRSPTELVQDINNILGVNPARDAALFSPPVQPPNQAATTTACSMVQTPGLAAGTNCPQCSSKLEFDIDTILDLKPLYCSGCGMKLTLDVNQSQQGLEFLRTIKSLANHCNGVNTTTTIKPDTVSPAVK